MITLPTSEYIQIGEEAVSANTQDWKDFIEMNGGVSNKKKTENNPKRVSGPNRKPSRRTLIKK